MAARRVNMHYSARETVALVLNEGSDLENVLDSGSEENIVAVSYTHLTLPTRSTV